METEKLEQVLVSLDEVLKQLRDAKLKGKVEIEQSLVEREPPFLPLTIDLTTARGESNPYELPFFPFSAIVVEDTSDTSVEVELALGREYPHIVQTMTLKRNRGYNLNKRASKAYLTFAAQSGKTISILLVKDGSIDLGNTLTTLSGGVNPISGGSLSTLAKKTVTTTAALLLAADSDATKYRIRNMGPNPVIIGSSAVTNDAGANPGAEYLNVGDVLTWDSQAETWAIAVGGTTYLAVNQHGA